MELAQCYHLGYCIGRTSNTRWGMISSLDQQPSCSRVGHSEVYLGARQDVLERLKHLMVDSELLPSTSGGRPDQ